MFRDLSVKALDGRICAECALQLRTTLALSQSICQSGEPGVIIATKMTGVYCRLHVPQSGAGLRQLEKTPPPPRHTRGP